jgi:predicted metal-dependent hydrolase
MLVLTVGGTEIPYELRRSATATQRRITVTPGCVEVLALTADDDVAIEAFLSRKRQWVFDAVRDMERITANRHSVPRFMTGSKIPYRGRKMPLTVRRFDGDRIEINYRNGFLVDLPTWVGDEADQLVGTEIKLWLKRRARRDVAEIAGGLRARFGLIPRSIRVGDFANGWGSCGPEGNLLINWHLIFAPKRVMAYVVAHELAHLRHRSHGTAFWEFLATIAPDFEGSKAWLERHATELSADFLATPCPISKI